jgi:hypothetical protein
LLTSGRDNALPLPAYCHTGPTGAFMCQEVASRKYGFVGDPSCDGAVTDFWAGANLDHVVFPARVSRGRIRNDDSLPASTCRFNEANVVVMVDAP